MLTNFEHLTQELNEDEHRMVDVIIARFKKLPGKQHVVTNTQIMQKLNEAYNLNLKEPRIRKLIQFIRMNNLLPGLVGTSQGYFYTNDVEEIQKWVDSMQERIRVMEHSRQIAQNHIRVLKMQAQPGSQSEILF